MLDNEIAGGFAGEFLAAAVGQGRGDACIAAAASANHLVLATRNLNYFRGLSINILNHSRSMIERHYENFILHARR